MKCSRCECQFSADSALVADHRYVQQCIDALKGEIKALRLKFADGPTAPIGNSSAVYGPAAILYTSAGGTYATYPPATTAPLQPPQQP